MKFRVLKTFEKDFKRLPRMMQRQAEEALGRLAEDPRHPSLHTKKMEGTEGIWEARISRAYRFTFHREGYAIVLRRIGTHDILKRESP